MEHSPLKKLTVPQLNKKNKINKKLKEIEKLAFCAARGFIAACLSGPDTCIYSQPEKSSPSLLILFL